MACSFDADKCTASCKKYPMCTFKATQEQISKLYESINNITLVISQLCYDNVELKERLDNYTISMLELIENKNREITEHEKD